jgi:hypothetical protein
MSEPATRAANAGKQSGAVRRTHPSARPLAAPAPSAIGALHARAGNRAASLAALGGNVPLPAAVREEMESRFGESFAGVRVHDDAAAHASAARMRAKAYTEGEHIVFGADRYAPQDARGKGLLAHELAHVLQQRRGGTAPAGGPQHEQEADAAAQRVASGAGPVAVQGASAVGVACAPDGAAPAPAPATAEQAPLQYEYIAPDGTKVVLSAEEFEKARQRAIRNVRLDLEQIEGLAANGRKTQQDLLGEYHGDAESLGDVVFSPKAWIGIAVDIRAGVTKPYIGMWSAPNAAIRAGRDALDKGDLREAARMLSLAAAHYKSAEAEWNTYLDAIQQGGDKLITELKVVRDVSFAIAIAAAAVLAAPVVAAGVAGLGITGGGAVALTMLGTGGVVAVGGAGLRGTAAAGGSYIVEGKVNTKDVAEETERGAKEGFVAGASAGLGTGVGKVLGVGAPGASTLTRIGGGAVAGGASGSVGEMTSAAFEGKSAKEVLKAGGRGLITGAVGGAAGGIGGAAKSPVVNKLVTAGVGAGTGALGTHLAGGSKDEVIASAAIGGATSLALAGAKPGMGKAEQKAFAAGRKLKNTIKAGTAAAMIGLEEGAPPTGMPAASKSVAAAEPEPMPNAKPGGGTGAPAVPGPTAKPPKNKAAKTKAPAAGAGVKTPTAKAPAGKAPTGKAKRAANAKKTIDERIADAKNDLNAARKKTGKYLDERKAAGKSLKGGPKKGIDNAKERLWMLERQKAYPKRQILESAEIKGVMGPDGKLTPASAIAGTGREPDFIEIEGARATMGELKSETEFGKSLSGGPAAGTATKVAPGSKMGGQFSAEDKILAYARQVKGKVIVSGYDLKTGQQVKSMALDPDQIGRALFSSTSGWGGGNPYTQ